MGNRSSAGYEQMQNRESEEIKQRIDGLNTRIGDLESNVRNEIKQSINCLTPRFEDLESNFRVINMTACREEKCSSYAKYCSLKVNCEKYRVMVNTINEENFRLQTEKKNFSQG